MNPTVSTTPTGSAPRTAEAKRHAERAQRLEREGNAKDALAEFDLALSMLAGARPSAQHADLLRLKGSLMRDLGDYKGAEPLYAKSLDMSRRLPYAGGIANALNCLAIVSQRRGDMKQARRLFAEAALNAVHAGERRLFSIIEQNLGALSMVQGDLKDAEARLRLSLRGFRDASDDEGACWVLCNLGRLHAIAGDHEDAERTAQEALALARRTEHVALEGLVELSRVESLLARGQDAEAEAACKRGLTVAEHRGDRAHRAESLRLMSMIAREKGELERATRSLDEARSLARESEDALISAEVERDAGELWLRRGEREPARLAWEQAVRRVRAMGAVRDAEHVERRLADLAA